MFSSVRVDLPESSATAWKATLEALQLNSQAGFDSIRDFLIQTPVDWVARYEATQSAQFKQNRKQGQLQNGVFYTPQPIASYLVQQTLEKPLQAYFAQQWSQSELIYNAQSITIIDPACGTGIFLVEALKAFYRFYQSLSLSEETLFQLLRHFVDKQCFGIDLDPLSVEITRLRLLRCFYQLAGQVLTDASQHVICGNALLTQTLERLPASTFSIVLGNPPYISEVRGQAEGFRTLKSDAIYYQAKMDLCDAFLAWGLEYVQHEGQVAYVLPEYWTQRSSTRLLRERLMAEGKIREYWTFEKTGVFPTAPGHHTALLIWEKQPEQNLLFSQPVWIGKSQTVDTLDETRLEPAVCRLDNASGKLVFGEPTGMKLLEKLSGLPPLLLPDEIQQGVILPQGRLKENERKRAGLQTAGVFLLTDAEVEALNLTTHERALLKPFFLPGNFRPFQGFVKATPDFWLIYTNAQNKKKLSKASEHYPSLTRHLLNCASVITSANAPYGLHRARQPEWFEEPDKVFSARQVFQPSFAVVERPAFIGEAFYSIRPRRVDLNVLVCILNSPLAHFWFYQQKRKGDRLQIDKDILRAFPQPEIIGSSQMIKLSHFGNVLRSKPNGEQSRRILRHINHLVLQLYGVSTDEAAWLQRQAFITRYHAI